MVQKYRSSVPTRDADGYLLYDSGSLDGSSSCKRCCCKCSIITFTVILVLALLAFLALFVAVPLVFMNSTSFQKQVVFYQSETGQDVFSQDFTNFRKYGLHGARNIYVNVKVNSSLVSLGVWHVLPLALLNEAVENDNFSYVDALRQKDHPVLLYFHSAMTNRLTDINKYRVLRRFFHVIAFDYRGYGDSSNYELSEESMVEDCVSLYKWLQTQTHAEIFMWGHSLGASLASSSAAKLHREGIHPVGLFMEAPFTSLQDAIDYLPTTKYFAWMPWYDATVVNPLKESGLQFKTNETIISVKCPIMVVHAEDDPVVPVELGKKLVAGALGLRDPGTQGNITVYIFPAQFGYGHHDLYQAAELPDYIKSHIKACREFQETIP